MRCFLKKSGIIHADGRMYDYNVSDHERIDILNFPSLFKRYPFVWKAILSDLNILTSRLVNYINERIALGCVK